MFLDGVTYAAIARNLAEGRGRFWEPFYTATIYPAFHEHPPLAFWLQSLWFRVLGDRWYVERLYCLAAAMLIAALIAVTWRTTYRGSLKARNVGADPRVRPGADPSTLVLSDVEGRALRAGTSVGPDARHFETGVRDLEWLPILLWISAPVVSWSIVGNLLETTVCVFVSAAVAAIAVASRGRAAAAIGVGCVSGLCAIGAGLSKGPVGFFPLVAPVFMAILPDRRRSTLWSAVGQWTTVAACAAVLWSIPSAHESLVAYFNQQIVTALAGEREVSGSSITIVIALLQGVWLPMGVALTLIVLAARGWVPPSSRDRQVALVFTLIGLSGTLPMLISPKQTGHYLMPAVPFYAIGGAAIVAETVVSLTHRLSDRGVILLRALTVALAIVGFAAIWVPAVERDPARLADLDRIATNAPRGEIIGICPASNSDWLLHAWMQRRFLISLDAGAPRAHEWFLKSTDTAADCPPSSCVPISATAGALSLMRCR